jgi:hypothetical protein
VVVKPVHPVPHRPGPGTRLDDAVFADTLRRSKTQLDRSSPGWRAIMARSLSSVAVGLALGGMLVAGLGAPLAA